MTENMSKYHLLANINDIQVNEKIFRRACVNGRKDVAKWLL
jgi:hypothetical protein